MQYINSDLVITENSIILKTVGIRVISIEARMELSGYLTYIHRGDQMIVFIAVGNLAHMPEKLPSLLILEGVLKFLHTKQISLPSMAYWFTEVSAFEKFRLLPKDGINKILVVRYQLQRNIGSSYRLKGRSIWISGEGDIVAFLK